jgi:hypothetical protein
MLDLHKMAGVDDALHIGVRILARSLTCPPLRLACSCMQHPASLP